MPHRTAQVVTGLQAQGTGRRLNPLCVRAFKAAADAAKLRGNPYVELVHFIEQLVLSDRSDVQMILADAGVDAGRLAGDMTRAIDKLPYGATSIEEFSDHIFHAIQEGWNYGSLEFGDEEVRSRLHPARLPEGAGARRAARQDQRRVRQDRRRRDRRAASTTCWRARSRAGARRPRPPPASRAAAGAGRRLGAGEIRHRPDRSARATARSTRSSAATRRSARSSTS